MVKAPKDPNAPKRPLSAYMMFANELRPKLMEENPGVHFTKLSSKISEQWKNIDESKRSALVSKANALKEQYSKDLEAYKKTDGYTKHRAALSQFKIKSAKKFKKDPNRPKKPASSFMLFANDQRASLKQRKPGLSVGEVGKELGAMWASLGESEKASWVAKAREAKAAYAKELEEYLGTDAAKAYAVQKAANQEKVRKMEKSMKSSGKKKSSAKKARKAD